MKLIRIIKDWDYPDLMRQSPGSRGDWGDFHFTLDPIQECDYVIVLNRVPEQTVVKCPQDRIWAVIQEPPIKEFRWLRKGFDQYSRIYTTDSSFQGNHVIHSQPSLPWHVNKSYDELKSCSHPKKSKRLSWITSDANRFRGHRKRLNFLETLRKDVDFDLWGRGFTLIEDKWGGLAPYRYSLAVENHIGDYYWSEKLADCFLSWTMPIYYGCTNISDYFPQESFVSIDIQDPDAIREIQEVVQSDLWERNMDAIEYARQLVLDKYQFFPHVTSMIDKYEGSKSFIVEDSKEIHLTMLPWLMPPPMKMRLQGYLRLPRSIAGRALRKARILN